MPHNDELLQVGWTCSLDGKCVENWNEATRITLRHEDVWESGCIDRHFLDLGTSWKLVVNFTPRPVSM
jgi:hypothetical protein